MPPVVIAEDAKLAVDYPNCHLVDRMQPFIENVAQGLALDRNLGDVISDASRLYPKAASHFEINGRCVEETFGLRDEYLFSNWNVNALWVSTPSSLYTIEVTGEEDELQALQDLLASCAAGIYDLQSIRSRLDNDTIEVFNDLLAAGVVVEQERRMPRFAPVGIPGIYRLQHASLLYRTPTAGILVDPHLHSTYRSDLRTDFCRDHLEGKVDAILISHFHFDHWFLSTIMLFPLETPIIVPKVPRSSIICGDMQSLLRNLGFRNVMAVDWFSEPIRIRDFEIHVLPFFGEQPLRFELPKHPDLRNWGNTYVVRTNYYTSWFLIDSGNDALGSMKDVAYHVADKIGPVDCVLSNLRRFDISHPLYINGGCNWLTLSARQIQEFKSMGNHCITLGPDGVAEVCQTVGAKYYLPYAHWWGELGSVGESMRDTPNQNEGGLLLQLSESLKKLGCQTQIVDWKIGDRFCPKLQGFECVGL